MFWKSRVENRSSAPRKLASIIIKQVGLRMVVRFNLDDGTFIDVEGEMPRFALREEAKIMLSEDVDLPTTNVEPSP